MVTSKKMMRRRPGIVTDTEHATVPGQRRSTQRSEVVRAQLRRASGPARIRAQNTLYFEPGA
jgi:hypothetical protein